MKTNFSQFHPNQFSFAEDPVLILEDFWSQKERKVVRETMARSKWIALADMPPVAQAFPNCGKLAGIGHWPFRCCPLIPTGRNALHCRLR